MSEMEQVTAVRAEKALKAQLAATTERDDLIWLMRDKRGRRIVWRELSDSGVFQLSYVPGDTHQTAFREGARNRGLQRMAEIMQHCPELFSKMQDEAKANRK